RTGWSRTWARPGADGRADPAHRQYLRPQPGVGPDTLSFFNDMEIVAIGSDTAPVERNFPADPGYTRKAFNGFQGLPLHVDFIWNRGAYIIEILNLDELAKDAAYEFLFVVGALLLRGGLGGALHAIPSE